MSIERRSDSGVTLVELLITVAIVGIAMIAIVSAMGTSVVSSDINRKQANTGAAIKSYAEAVKAAPYVPCAAPSDYSPASVTFAVPSGMTATATAVEFWNGTAFVSSLGSCPGSDQGLQRISLRVAATDGRSTDTLQVGKRRP